MKRISDGILYSLSLALLVLVSCDRHENNGDICLTGPDADYTVMMYGCGGGDLDENMIYNLEQAESYGYTPRVHFSAKLKFSRELQEEAGAYGGTRLFTLTENGLENECVADREFRLDDPRNIADYILDTRRRLPAKHYVLILWNHGDGFSIGDQLVEKNYPSEAGTRGVAFDDNTNENISIFELEERLRRAGVKMDLIYWDACLMNMLENLYQIKERAAYTLGSAHLVPGIGGNYAQLMHALDNHPVLLEAMREYVPATVAHWGNVLGEDDGRDLTLCNMEYIDGVVQNAKEYVDEFLRLRGEMEADSEEEMYFQKINGTVQPHYHSDEGVLYFFHNDEDEFVPSADMYSAFTRIGNRLMSGRLSAITTRMRIALGRMIPVSACHGIPDYMDRVSVGISWMERDDFMSADQSHAVPSLDELYPLLNFDRATGWSRFLRDNVMRKSFTE